eukprot:CAMPEP_0172169432 /NCGR_PEP_ID=MMETSP1050-20130122/10700_1 /TAXON_ID=233186 /ORGANISM="Cryptomonas curvata, Strain CCAP979/52" /LENGTH=463 /DNA_ID=CAMNT_0012840485 /DNA_START=198 /DNA_END=1589 /DNA_ORIENTATION=+
MWYGLGALKGLGFFGFGKGLGKTGEIAVKWRSIKPDCHRPTSRFLSTLYWQENSWDLDSCFSGNDLAEEGKAAVHKVVDEEKAEESKRIKAVQAVAASRSAVAKCEKEKRAAAAAAKRVEEGKMEDLGQLASMRFGEQAQTKTPLMAHARNQQRTATTTLFDRDASPVSALQSPPAAKLRALTFASSTFKRLHREARCPAKDFELLISIESFLRAICDSVKLPNSLQVADAFLEKVRREALGEGRNSVVAQRVDEFLDSVPGLAQRLWTSLSELNWKDDRRVELCTLINLAIRLDESTLLKELMPMIKAINSLCVSRGKVDGCWPHEGRCFRGGGLPDCARVFFQAGAKYRVPGFLATSFSETVAFRFAERQFTASNGEMPAVMWTVQVDPRGASDSTLRCKQVTYVKHSNLGEEQEFLFAPYSVFTVTRTQWSAKPNYRTPHCIWVEAALDNFSRGRGPAPY